MNIVLLADKKVRKTFESAVKKNPNITLLGTEMVIRGNTISRIAEHHNPHAVVIYKNVPEKDGMTVKDTISFLRIKKPHLRIIYVFEQMVNDTAEFIETAKFLMGNNVFDIALTNDLSEIIKIIENPMTKEDIQSIIDEISNSEQENIQDIPEKFKSTDRIFESLALDFPAVSALDEFDIENIETISKNISEDVRTVIIGLIQLQHHNGCTHTAFEIASMLAKKNSVAVIIADSDTYDNLTRFYEINPVKARKGLNIQRIDVYPYNMYSEIKSFYNAVIIDFGYMREKYKKSFSSCHIKIMMCSSAEWDMSVIMNYINFSKENYIHDINYCFSRISLSRFVKYNKQLIKSGCNAYRLQNSSSWSCPHSDNIIAYKDILSPFTIQNTAPKQKRKLIKAK